MESTDGPTETTFSFRELSTEQRNGVAAEHLRRDSPAHGGLRVVSSPRAIVIADLVSRRQEKKHNKGAGESCKFAPPQHHQTQPSRIQRWAKNRL
jgi:hypothetical protein